jgi:hypothetical protein
MSKEETFPRNNRASSIFDCISESTGFCIPPALRALGNKPLGRRNIGLTFWRDELLAQIFYSIFGKEFPSILIHLSRKESPSTAQLKVPKAIGREGSPPGRPIESFGEVLGNNVSLQ